MEIKTAEDISQRVCTVQSPVFSSVCVGLCGILIQSAGFGSININFSLNLKCLRGGPGEEAIFMRYAQLNISWISHVFIQELLFNQMSVCCCCNLMFYDGSECVMSVLGITKHSQCKCIDT